jgi:hypothetical protein
MKNSHKRILTILNIAYSDCNGLLPPCSVRVLVKKIAENRAILISEALDELRSGVATGEYGVLLVLIEFANDHSQDQETNSSHWKQFIGLVKEMNTELFSLLRIPLLRNPDCAAA